MDIRIICAVLILGALTTGCGNRNATGHKHEVESGHTHMDEKHGHRHGHEEEHEHGQAHEMDRGIHHHHAEGETEPQAGANSVVFSDQMRASLDFSVETLSLKPLGQSIETMAQILPSTGDECVVSAKASGIVLFNGLTLSEGVPVSQGQILLSVESAGLGDENTKLRLDEAKFRYETARDEYERKAELAKDKIVSQSEVQRARADYRSAEARYENLRDNVSGGSQSVVSPFNGYISRICVLNGESVQAGQPLLAVARNRKLLAKAEVPSKFYSQLKHIVGANFRPLNSGQTYTLEELGGRLLSYGKGVSSEHPLIPITFEVDNKFDLLPGTFMEVYIMTEDPNPVISVPNTAIVEEMGNYLAYVHVDGEVYEKRELKVGRTDGLRTEVISGLREGDCVVTHGAAMLKLTQAASGVDVHSGHVH